MGSASSQSPLDHGGPRFEEVKRVLKGKTLRIPNLREILAQWPLEVNVHAGILETAVEAGLAQCV